MRINVQNVEILIKIIFKKVQVYIYFWMNWFKYILIKYKMIFIIIYYKYHISILLLFKVLV